MKDKHDIASYVDHRFKYIPYGLQIPLWVVIQRKGNQHVDETSASPCLLQHYTQQAKYRINLVVHQYMSGEHVVYVNIKKKKHHPAMKKNDTLLYEAIKLKMADFILSKISG